jgi:hypothetical protein
MAKKRPTRKQLENRAARRAAAAHAADQAALDSETKAAQHTYNQGVGASHAAKQANNALLEDALANAEALGLRGLAAQQYVEDIAGRMEDAKGMVKYDTTALKADRREEMARIAAQQAVVDAGIAEDTQSELQTAVKKQREKAQAAREAETKFDREIATALAEIRAQVTKARGSNPAAINAARKAIKMDPRGIQNLVDYLHTSQGISQPAAIKAAKAFVYKRKSGAGRDPWEFAGDAGEYFVQGLNPDYRDPLPWDGPG